MASSAPESAYVYTTAEAHSSVRKAVLSPATPPRTFDRWRSTL